MDDYDDYPPPRRQYHTLRCQCGPNLPGSCPGPTACPYSGCNDEEQDSESES